LNEFTEFRVGPLGSANVLRISVDD
jgi:hypothetical protein